MNFCEVRPANSQGSSIRLRIDWPFLPRLKDAGLDIGIGETFDVAIAHLLPGLKESHRSQGSVKGFFPASYGLWQDISGMKWDGISLVTIWYYNILYVTKVMNTHNWAFKPVTAVLRAWSNCGDRMSPVAQFRSLHPSGTLESWLLELGMRYDAI